MIRIILIFSMFCLCTYFYCFVVISCYFYCFICTSVGLLPLGVSPSAVSSSSINTDILMYQEYEILTDEALT